MSKNNEEYFKEIGTSSVIQPYFDSHKGELKYGEHIGWDGCPLSLELILKEPLLNKIHNQYRIKQGGILRTKPFRYYQWHQDQDRGVSINLLLTPNVHSYTLFGTPSPDHNTQLDIVRLLYKPNTFYLFNTQVLHTVINFEEERFLFSIEFEQNKHTLSYAHLI